MISTTPMHSAAQSSASCLELDIHLLPLRDGQVDHRQLNALLAPPQDEHDSVELSLEQLEELSGGVGLVDAMVSSSILMVIVSQSAGLFGNSMDALSNSKLRDGLNAAISADLELVRDEVSNWASGTSMDGQITYEPGDAECSAGTLGEALLTAKSDVLPVASTLDLSSAPTALRGTTINRSISVDPSNKNLIHISYATADGSPISVNQSTTLATPAQGWCA